MRGLSAKLKALGYVLLGFLALVGLAFCTLAGVVCCSAELCGTKAYTGQDCSKRLTFRALPLPPRGEEQEAGLRFPLVLEEWSFFKESGVIIFRASPEWQETFRRFYPAEAVPEVHLAETAALDWSADLPDKSIHSFVKQRRWLPFHSGRMRGQCFSALRDESGAFLLLYIY